MSNTSDGGGGLRTYERAVTIVTGGGSGIGAALARGLVARGAHVILADRDEEAARGETERLAAGGGSAEAVTLDVRDRTAVEKVVTQAFAGRGRLDYLFNNAGIGIGGEAQDLSLDDWTDTLDVNLMGPIHGLLSAYPRMVEQGFGHIVNTASMAAYMATPMAAPYGAAKHAVLGLSRALRVEGADHGVRVSVVCPGVVRTPILVDAGKYGRVPVELDRETQRALWERLRPMDPDLFATRTLDAVARNRGLIVYPAWWRLVRLLNAVAPALGEALALREYRKAMLLIRSAAPRSPKKTPS